MIIEASLHSKMRAKERIKGINNGEEAQSFLIKEFKKILKEYRSGKAKQYNGEKGTKILINSMHKFYFYKKPKKYIIVTYFDNTQTRNKETSKMMKNIRRHMRELNGVYGYSKNTNNY